MQIVPLVLATVIVIVGVFFSQKNARTSKEETPKDKEVLSEEVGEEITPTMVPTDWPTKSVKPTVVPTTVPQEPSNLSDFKYPQATVITSAHNSLLLETTDGSDVVTNWYKDKINSLGMNVKTFVTTKANDKVLNKLVGVDGNFEIRVEITQENTSSSVKISVSLQ